MEKSLTVRDQDQDIIDGLRNGKAEAWAALYDVYATRVWQRIGYLVGPDQADVADVFQETFMAATKSAHTYDPDQAPLWAWLSGIARNQAALHFRRTGSQHLIKDAEYWLAQREGQIARWLGGEQTLPQEALESEELTLLVRKTLVALPDDYARLLSAKYFDGHTIDEIAAAEQCTHAAINSKLARARDAFRAAFPDNDSDPSESDGQLLQSPAKAKEESP